MMKKKGFTLLELLVVISIIAVLLAISASAFLSARATSRDAKRKTDLEQVRSALELYKADNGSYPTNTGTVGSVLTGLVSPTQYISKLPSDPGLNSYYYMSLNTGGYALCAALEKVANTTSVYYCTGNSQCTAKCNYEVTNP